MNSQKHLVWKSILCLILLTQGALACRLFPIPYPFQMIVRWALFFTSTIIWYDKRITTRYPMLPVYYRNALIVGMTICYAMKIGAAGGLDSVLTAVYFVALGVIAYLWLNPAPCGYKYNIKSIALCDWILPIATGIYIISYELLSYYVP